jgi:prepilin-type N-terminal cleavage/methylation domain-containing protein
VTRLRHPSDEAGFTLIELLTVLAILGIVLAALTTLMVAGLRTEAEQTNRANGQLEARLALDKLRREVHCGTSVSSNGGIWPTQSVTIALPTYCPTNTGAAASVTWCTSPSGGSGPYAMWRYPHSTDLSSASYATACADTGSGGVKWATNIVNSTGSVASGQVFSSPVTPTTSALAPPDLTFGTTAGTLGSTSSMVTYGYIVDPVVSGTEQPGTEGVITVQQQTIANKSILIDWTQPCSLYAQKASIGEFKVYGRTPNGEQLLTTITSTACATTTWTDTGSGTPSGQPVGATLAKMTITLPIRGGAGTYQRLITVQDDVTLRNTPR